MTPENEANFDELIKALAAAAGLDGMEKDNGRLLFAIDDDMGVSIAPADAEDAGVDLAVAAIIIGLRLYLVLQRRAIFAALVVLPVP